MDCRDPQVLEKVIQWKREKFRRTRTFDLLSLDWTSNLLRELFHVRRDDFRGQLTVLWAGGIPVSGHMGFVSKHRLHYYMPAHDHQFRRFSPGTELMIQLTGAALEHGIHKIDFGYGESELKDRFANAHTTVDYGCIGFNSAARLVAHQRYRFRQALKQVPLKEPLKKIVRTIHPKLGQGTFR